MAINPADDEINILLPLVFGLLVFCFVAIICLIVWILNKTKVADFSKNSHPFGVFKAVILTIVGFFIFSSILGAVVTFIEIIGKSFVK